MHIFNSVSIAPVICTVRIIAPISLSLKGLNGVEGEEICIGLIATRATVRGDLAEQVKTAADRELAEQMRLRQTEDFAEGVKAVSERRSANFVSR